MSTFFSIPLLPTPIRNTCRNTTKTNMTTTFINYHSIVGIVSMVSLTTILSFTSTMSLANDDLTNQPKTQLSKQSNSESSKNSDSSIKQSTNGTDKDIVSIENKQGNSESSTEKATHPTAEYFVGKYMAVGYDKTKDTPYKVTVKLEKSEAAFLAMNYYINGVEFTGTIEQEIIANKASLLLKSHAANTESATKSESYCQYQQNTGTMSAEIVCHGSLFGEDGFFAMKMDFD